MVTPAIGALRYFALIAAMTLLGCVAAEGQPPPTVNITIPASVTFSVTNVNVSTDGTPDPFIISFTDAGRIGPRQAFRISVRAQSSIFTPPAGSSIPASDVSWTISSAQGGTGYAGTLSSTAYTVVYQSVNDPSSGSVSLVWDLAAPGAGGIRAGNHTLLLTWKLEVVIP